jgi:hypothetical protein
LVERTSEPLRLFHEIGLCHQGKVKIEIEILDILRTRTPWNSSLARFASIFQPVGEPGYDCVRLIEK